MCGLESAARGVGAKEIVWNAKTKEPNRACNSREMTRSARLSGPNYRSVH
jgi:hypothetical protein